MNGFGLAFAVPAGMLATVNPCAFPMLPAFAAYFTGTTEEGYAALSIPARIWRGLLAGLMVTAGFTAVFVLAAVLTVLGGKPLLFYAHWLAWVVAGGMIVLGLALLTGRELHVPLPSSGGVLRTGLRGMLGYGIAYGAASLSCTLPVFLLVVVSALTASGLLATLADFAAYTMGMALVLVAVAVTVSLGKAALAATLQRLLPHYQRFAGALVTAGGIWLLYVQVSSTLVR